MNKIVLAISFAFVLAVSGCVQDGNSEDIASLSFDEVMENSANVSYDDLMRHNERYVGEIVYFRGGVMQASQVYGDSYVLRVVTDLYFIEDDLWVNYKGERLLEGDVIDLWGRVRGLKTYTAILGNEVTIPEIDSLYVVLVRKAG